MYELKDHIWSRQYAIHPEESFEEGLRRVARHVAQAEAHYGGDPAEWAERFYRAMAEGRFVPGGRILAGSGTAHGNLLNCFVLDSAPYEGATTQGVLHLAKKLALITKVGGGTGLNLDPIPPKRPFTGKTGQLYLHISPAHPNFADVRDGRVTDRYTGEKVTRGYRAARFGRGPEGGRCLTVPDSIEGIWDTAHDAIAALLAGEDVTVDLTLLRPEGEPVQGSGGTSSGPASFAVEIFDNYARWAHLGGAEHAGPVATLRYVYAPTLRVIKQGGSRRGAGMATLSAWHADVFDFITAKDLERETAEGDISTFNISVLADELFMGLVLGRWAEADEDRAKALERFKAIAEHAHATGEPGLLFVDTINLHNPLRRSDGPIVATNPCGEVTLYAGEPCDLGAINLAAFVRDRKVDFAGLAETAKLAVRFLDDVLDVEQSPLPEIHEAIRDKRRVGLGVMGLADMLIKLGLEYGSPEGRVAVQRVMATLVEAGLEASEELGKERGVPAGVRRAGLDRRNIALFTVAPTGTTSMLAGVTSGVEPLFAATYRRRIGTEVREVVHPLLLEMLEEERAREWLDRSPGSPLARSEGGRWTWDLPRLLEALNKAHGSVQPLVKRGWLPPWFAVLQTAHDLDPEAHIRMQDAVQTAMDYYLSFTAPGLAEGKSVESCPTHAGNSISKTINLPNQASVADVRRAYELAYTLGLKGCTVYRDGSRGFQVLSAGDAEADFEAWAEEVEREGALLEFDDGTLVDLDSRTVYAPHPQPPTAPTGVRVRESVIDSRTHKYAVGGRKVYVTVGWNRAGEVVEAFITLSKPTPNEAVAVDIVGRLVSLAFKYGASVDDVTKHLEGHFDQSGGLAEGLGFVNSLWDVVAAALRQYRSGPGLPGPEREAVGVPGTRRGDCPECGEGTLVRKGGCNKCERCGYEACG
jgi:ribonucleoside-diphosphate reductase alpha chain